MQASSGRESSAQISSFSHNTHGGLSGWSLVGSPKISLKIIRFYASPSSSLHDASISKVRACDLRLTILHGGSHHGSYNDRVEQWPILAKTSRRATITEMRPVLYIFALERAVESRNRLLEDQLHVTVRDGERRPEPERFFSFSLRSCLVRSKILYPARSLVCVSRAP